MIFTSDYPEAIASLTRYYIARPQSFYLHDKQVIQGSCQVFCRQPPWPSSSHQPAGACFCHSVPKVLST